MTDWLRRAAEGRPDHPALVTPDRSISYADLDRAANGAAALVGRSGIGGPVAVWGDRTPETVALLWGVLRAGVPGVLVDPAWPPSEQQRLTRSTGARGLLDPPAGGIERLVAAAAPDPDHWGPPDPSARIVVFTSGSEGGRKGVVLTGANLATSVAGIRDRVGNGPDTAWLCVLPLFHVGGLGVLWRQAEQAATLILDERFEPDRVAGMLGEVAFASLVPTMLRRVLAIGPRGGATVLVGGAPAPPALLRRARNAGLLPLETYGMTETASAVCVVSPDRFDEEVGTAGMPVTGAEVRVVGEGAPVVGEEGPVEVRGAMVSTETIGEPPRPEGAWLRTGDLGVVDEAGRLRVVGRADAVIVTGGENVHPAAVAAVLESHPAVAAVRVFGEADPEWGARVVAEAVLDGAGPADVLAWARDRLTPAELPKEIRVVEAIPGKLEWHVTRSR